MSNDDRHLLPPSATAAERALSMSTERAALDGGELWIGYLWRPWDCPAGLLPWLAWAVAVDEWDAAWPEGVKRAVVAGSIERHRRRGTVWSVRETLIAAGYADARLVEGAPILTHDGEHLFDGIGSYSGGSRWAIFDLEVDLGETAGISAVSLATLNRLLDGARPVARHLRTVAYKATVADDVEISEASSRHGEIEAADPACFGVCYNGAISHDQATPVVERDPVTFDGAWLYNGEQGHVGESVYLRWAGVGTRYNNARCLMSMDEFAAIQEDGYIAAPVTYSGRSVHDGSGPHGTGYRPTDVCLISYVQDARFNGRHGYQGLLRHQGSLVAALSA